MHIKFNINSIPSSVFLCCIRIVFYNNNYGTLGCDRLFSQIPNQQILHTLTSCIGVASALHLSVSARCSGPTASGASGPRRLLFLLSLPTTSTRAAAPTTRISISPRYLHYFTPPYLPSSLHRTFLLFPALPPALLLFLLSGLPQYQQAVRLPGRRLLPPGSFCSGAPGL